jgi:alpha-L-fucosidase
MFKKVIYLFILFALSCKTEDVPPPSAILPVPSQSHLEWQQKELFAFVHFTVNTFTDKEWGYGDEDADVFNPFDYNPDQWAKVFKDAGFRGVILTAKHHDGFCLWPSSYTEYSVKNSSWRNGEGDVVGELKDACVKQGLEFGIYLSPWDRNHADYGSPLYVEYYQNQLNELLKKYGPIFEIWFDGANGGDGFYGGARETRKIDDQVYYKWDETFSIVKKYNPKTIIRGDARSSAICDSRWCGNEKGFVGETNWNMITPDSVLALGNNRREMLNEGSEYGKYWMPAEVDVSIRPGWFYHASQDSLVKTPEELFDIYLTSVGRGSPLLLNVAPDKRGLIPDPDVESLLKWKKIIDEEFSVNLTTEANISADSYRGKSSKYSADNLTDGNGDTYWATDDGVKAGTIEFEFKKPQEIKFIVLQEYIPLGQRIKSFAIEIRNGGEWDHVAEATTIGYKRIIHLEPVKAEKIRVNITDSRACPVLSNIEIY